MPIPLNARPITTRSEGLAHDVYDRISQAILDETLLPDEPLSETDLALWLGVSRTPIRAALARLELLGLVERTPSRVLRVTSVDANLRAETLQFTGYQAGICMHLALPRMSNDELKHACALLESLIAANEGVDVNELYDAGRKFYAHITAHSGNSVLHAMMRETGVVLERNMRAERPQLGDQSFRSGHYRELLACMRARDADGAERAIRAQHLIG